MATGPILAGHPAIVGACVSGLTVTVKLQVAVDRLRPSRCKSPSSPPPGTTSHWSARCLDDSRSRAVVIDRRRCPADHRSTRTRVHGYRPDISRAPCDHRRLRIRTDRHREAAGALSTGCVRRGVSHRRHSRREQTPAARPGCLDDRRSRAVVIDRRRCPARHRSARTRVHRYRPDIRWAPCDRRRLRIRTDRHREAAGRCRPGCVRRGVSHRRHSRREQTPAARPGCLDDRRSRAVVIDRRRCPARRRSAHTRVHRYRPDITWAPCDRRRLRIRTDRHREAAGRCRPAASVAV